MSFGQNCSRYVALFLVASAPYAIGCFGETTPAQTNETDTPDARNGDEGSNAKADTSVTPDAGSQPDAMSSADTAMTETANPDARLDSDDTDAAGEDLLPPPAGTGMQIVWPHDQPAVHPGDDFTKCYYATLSATTEFDVGGIQSWASPAGVFELNVYKSTSATAADGTVDDCTNPVDGSLIYLATGTGLGPEVTMPDGVAIAFGSGVKVIVAAHFINTSSLTLSPEIKLNLFRANNAQYAAMFMVAFNVAINVPAGTPQTPGVQTVSGSCVAAAGSKFFFMTTRTRSLGTAASVKLTQGASSSELVHTGASPFYPPAQQPGTGLDWSNPGVSQWSAPDFLTEQSGDSFDYSCTYANTTNVAVTAGAGPGTELCMPSAYFFPASSVSCH